MSDVVSMTKHVLVRFYDGTKEPLEVHKAIIGVASHQCGENSIDLFRP